MQLMPNGRQRLSAANLLKYISSHRRRREEVAFASNQKDGKTGKGAEIFERGKAHLPYEKLYLCYKLALHLVDKHRPKAP
jgi:hypothetical protein